MLDSINFRKAESMGQLHGVKSSTLLFRRYITIIPYLYAFLLHGTTVCGQSTENYTEFKSLTKRVYHFTKVEFITPEGEFNDAICTLVLPDLVEDSPPYVAIYYKRDNSEWFTESLYRKRVRYSFRDGIVKLDRSNFWDWYEVSEIKVVIIY